MKNMNSARWKRSRSDACFIYKLDEYGLNIWSTQVTPDNDHPKREAEAAARLMFAAPDLLEALRTAVQLVETDVICARPGDRKTLIAALKDWNAAITKATQGA